MDPKITCVTDDGPIAGIDPNARVAATEGALELLAEIKARHGEVMFHQSGGCCDGSSPMCYAKGEFPLGSSDVKLGEIDGTEFFYIRSAVRSLEAHATDP